LAHAQIIGASLISSCHSSAYHWWLSALMLRIMGLVIFICPRAM